MRRLYRSRIDRKLGGVCGGMAEYFDIDPVLLRLLAIVAIFFSAGSAVLAYVAAWIIIPEKEYEEPPSPPPQS